MMNFRMVMECRQTLIQSLGLESRYFQSVLVRTETLLQDPLYQRGLELLNEPEEEFNSVLDYLLSVLSDRWSERVNAYYMDIGPILAETVPWKDIGLMDRVLHAAVVELSARHRLLRQEGWLSGDGDVEPSDEIRDMTTRALREFLGPMLPEVKAVEERKVA